jgi:hypothetical protein
MTQSSLVRQRPASVLVLAILHLVGGTIDLLGVLCSGVMQFAGPGGLLGMPGGGAGPDPTIRLQQAIEAIPGQKAFTAAELVVNLVLDLLLLAGGIGLLNMKSWARTTSLVYAPLAILNRLGTLIYTLVVLVPGFETILQEELGRDPQFKSFGSLMKTSMILGAVIGALFIIYPIVVLIILNLRTVTAAFRGETASPPLSLPDDEGWGPIRRPGASSDVTTQPDPDRDHFQPPT